MSEIQNEFSHYWNDVSNEDDRVWLDALWGLRGRSYRRAKQIEKIISLLNSCLPGKETSRADKEIYEALIAQAKNTYKLTVLKIDPITQTPSKYKITEEV